MIFSWQILVLLSVLLPNAGVLVLLLLTWFVLTVEHRDPYSFPASFAS